MLVESTVPSIVSLPLKEGARDESQYEETRWPRARGSSYPVVVSLVVENSEAADTRRMRFLLGLLELDLRCEREVEPVDDESVGTGAGSGLREVSGMI